MEFTRESEDLQAVVFYIGGIEFVANHLGIDGFVEATWKPSKRRDPACWVGKFSFSDEGDLKLLRTLVLGGWLTEAAHKHNADRDNMAGWVAKPNIPARKLQKAILSEEIPRVDLDRIKGWTKSDLVEVLLVISRNWSSIEQKAFGRGIRTAIGNQTRSLDDLDVEEDTEGI